MKKKIVLPITIILCLFAVVYIIKKPQNDTENKMYFCPDCYNNGKKTMLQLLHQSKHRCNTCNTDFITGTDFLKPFTGRARTTMDDIEF